MLGFGLCTLMELGFQEDSQVNMWDRPSLLFPKLTFILFQAQQPLCKKKFGSGGMSEVRGFPVTGRAVVSHLPFLSIYTIIFLKKELFWL